MQLCRVSALIISLVAQVTVTCVSSQSTFMYIRVEPQNVNYYRSVLFYKDTFQRLYDCMQEMSTKQCNVRIELVKYTVQDVTSIQGYNTHRGYFTCQFNQFSSSLECSRSTTSQCEGDLCISFRRRNSSNCDTDCVYLMWQYAEEKLVFDDKTDQFDDCKQICAQTTNTLFPSTQLSDASTLRPEPPTDTTANSSSAPAVNETIASGDPPDNVALIIGVVCGVLFLFILVIAIGVIYRRHMQTKSHSRNNDVDSSRTDTNYDEITAQHRETKISNISNMPDVLTTLPHSGHATERNGESEDGYYTIDNCNALNRYENSLETMPSKTSTINDDLHAHQFHRFQDELKFSRPILHDQWVSDVNSELSHSREGEYFTLEPENNDVNDCDTDNEHNDMGCGYSLAKDVSTIDVSTTDVNKIDVIDVSSPAKNIYSRFGNNATDKINPYDMLLQPQGIQNSRPN